jgi:hypothetical protein
MPVGEESIHCQEINPSVRRVGRGIVSDCWVLEQCGANRVGDTIDFRSTGGEVPPERKAKDEPRLLRV